MIYEYRCKVCQTVLHRTSNTTIPKCPICDSDRAVKRVWGFSMATVMQEHWSTAVGKPISDPKQFRRELAAASEDAERRTGTPHDFQPIDGPITFDSDDGLKEQHDRAVAEGRQEPFGKFVHDL
jgi:hypothetical protein